MLVGVRLRRRPEFRWQVFFHDVCFTPCRGDVCRADVLDRTGFRTAGAARAVATATAAIPAAVATTAAAIPAACAAAGGLSAAAAPGGAGNVRTRRTGCGRA